MAFGRLYYTIGLPRSGKSSFAASWVNYGTTSNRNVVISGDSIRLATHGHRFIIEAEPTVHLHKTIALKALLLEGFNVLYDGTNSTKESQFEVWKIDEFAIPIWVPERSFIGSKLWIQHIDDCKQRAIESGHDDLFPAIDRIAIQLAELNLNFNKYREEFEAYLAHKKYKTFRQRMTKCQV